MVRYDPKVIQAIARRMYDQAGTTVLLCTLIGAVIGLVVGVAVVRDWRGLGDTPAGWVVLALCVLACGVAGLVFGNYRAAWLRFEAQTALCQVQIEANSRRASLPGNDVFADIQP